MSRQKTFSFASDSPSHTVRLFPLPSMVMFPHALQALHLFEPRYCEMLQDSIGGDDTIGMALLAPGWEKNYEGRPAIESVICICRIAAFSQEENGQFNLLLRGGQRAVIVEEHPPQHSYRLAEVKTIDDYYPPSGAGQRLALRRELLNYFRQFPPAASIAQEQFDSLFNSQTPLGMLTDAAAYTIGFSLSFKQQLLGESNVDHRARMLIKQLALESSLSDSSQRPYPPEFSLN